MDRALVLVVSLPSDRNPSAVYLARLAPSSRRPMRDALETIAGLLTGGSADAMSVDWSAVRYQHSQAVRSALAAKYAPATANRMLSALRGVLREAWRLGLSNAEDYQRAADIETVRGERLPRGRALSMGELGALMRACSADESAAGVRDAALLGLLYGSGMRRAEVVALDLADFDRESGALVIREGKGRKDRTVYATNGAADALTDWLTARGTEPGPLFLPVNRGGSIVARRMTGQAVLYVVARRAEDAKVATFSPHDLRRTMISHLLDAGADIVTVQKLAGHSNVQTTARYDRRGEETKKRAAELLHVPYQRRG